MFSVGRSLGKLTRQRTVISADLHSIVGRNRGFSDLHSNRTGSGAHLASYPISDGVSFLT